MSWVFVCSLTFAFQLQPVADTPATPTTIVRLLDVTGDGLLDKLRFGHDGTVSVAINVGTKSFLPIRQELPTVKVTDVLVSDLDEDGLPDLYLVSPQDNVALLGDGAGYFRVATETLGLGDAGLGKTAERIDVDGDRLFDLVLHNVGGDVLFWAIAPGHFESTEQTRSNATGAGVTTTSGGATTPGGGTTVATPPSGPAGVQPVDVAPPGGSSVLTIGPSAGGMTLGGRHRIDGPAVPPIIPPIEEAILDDKYVNDNMNEVDSADILDGSLTGADVSTSSGDVSFPGAVLTAKQGVFGTGAVATGSDSTVSGGLNNTASGYVSAVGGGFLNIASGDRSTVGGGLSNTASGNDATIGGGISNTASGVRTTIAGGRDNTASGVLGTIGGGKLNEAGIGSTVGGGRGNAASSYLGFGTVGGGLANTASGNYATIGGGLFNTASGGLFLGGWTTVGGGYFNTASNYFATVSGGYNNTASGNYATIGAGAFNDAGTGSTIGGGMLNDALGYNATVGGGNSNTASGSRSTVGGGVTNTASGSKSTIGGGRFNDALGYHSTVGGGGQNNASRAYATISGGADNAASGNYSTVPGGEDNVAQGSYSFAAGRRAKANHDGSFVWGDSFNADKPSSANDEFNVFASGGARIFSNSAATSGVLLAPGGNSWSAVSDRAVKEHFEAVDVRAVLKAVAAMPITTWNYKSQDDAVRHMGPMAQDFRAAFGLGVSDKLIDTIDPDGVALAAIQGLNEVVAEKDAEIARNEVEIAGLRSDVETLKSQVTVLMQR